MKKLSTKYTRIYLLTIMFSSLFILTGCMKMETFPTIKDANTQETIFLPNISEWKSFKFNALNGEYKDLVVTRGEPRTKTNNEKTYTVNTLLTSKYVDDDIILIGTYNQRCESCDKQAAYFTAWRNKIAAIRQYAEEHQPGMDWSFVSFSPMAVYLNPEAQYGVSHSDAVAEADLRSLTKQGWFQELSEQGVDVYDNVLIHSCAGGACRVLIPMWEEKAPLSGTLICLNKNAIEDSVVIIDKIESERWKAAQTQEELDDLAKKAFYKIQHDCLGVHEIAFNAIVDDWENGGSNDVNL